MSKARYAKTKKTTLSTKLKERETNKKVKPKPKRKEKVQKDSISKVISEKTPTFSTYLILILLFIVAGLLYYITPDSITISTLEPEITEEDIREIVVEVLEEYDIADEEVVEEVVETVEESTEEEETETVTTTSRGDSSTRSTTTTTTTLTGYRVTSYYPGDAYGSGKKTGSGLTTSDFGTTTVEGKTVYTYKGKLVAAAATEELLASGYSKNGGNVRQEGKYYFSYYDEISICINGTWYDCIILDSCGASMWTGEYRIDLFVTNASNLVNASNVSVSI